MLQANNLRKDVMTTQASAVARNGGAVESISAAGSIVGLSAAKLTSGQPVIDRINRNIEVVTAAAPVVFSGAVGYGACCLWQWALVD